MSVHWRERWREQADNVVDKFVLCCAALIAIICISRIDVDRISNPLDE